MADLKQIVDRTIEATVLLSFTSIGYAVRDRLFDFTEVDATGKVVLITGATSGLGKSAATQLARAGASVRFLARDEEKSARVRDEIIAASGNEDVEFGIADLADFDAVRSFAKQFAADHERLDALVHNAGALLNDRVITGDGLEFTFQTQVVSPTLLTAELRPLLARSAGSEGHERSESPEQRGHGRVVFVSSGGMYSEQLDADRVEMRKHGYKGTVAYARCKRAQLGLMHRWSKSLAPDGITVNAMHPGWAATPGVEDSLPIFNKVLGPALREPEQGADTIVWLAASDEADGETNGFWLDRARRPEHKLPSTKLDPVEEAREEAELWTIVREAAGLDDDALGEFVDSAS